jgi:hypothetical protein
MFEHECGVCCEEWVDDCEVCLCPCCTVMSVGLEQEGHEASVSRLPVRSEMVLPV